MMVNIDYLDGFSGYGGFHKGLEEAGVTFNNVYYSEIDKHAIANYSYNFPNSIYVGSITDVSRDQIPRLDLFTFGWPCQDNSIAGKRKGQSEGTRSGLLHQAVRILNIFKPRNFIAENVLGLLSVNEGADIISSLELLSYLNESCPQYDIEMQLLNTRWLLPQNRERLFFVGHLRGSGSRQIFPIGENHIGATKGATNPAVVRCFTAGGHSGGMHSGMTLLKVNLKDGIRLNDSKIARTVQARDYKSYSNQDMDFIAVKSATVSGFEIAQEGDSVNMAMPDSKTRRGRVGKKVAQTLDTSCNQAAIQKGNIRRLAPLEAERLQGLPDNWTKYGNYDGIIKDMSDTQRYRLCGNGVSVPIIKMIANKLFA